MKLLPRDRFSIQTLQPLPVVIEKLEPHIEAPRIRWGFSRKHALYTGTISSSGFTIRRIIHYRNSFLPRIQGQFEPSAQGTIVHITMGLHPLVIAFLLVWGSLWYTTAIPITLSGFMTGDVLLEMSVLALGAPLAAILIFWLAFWAEAKRSRRELTEIIQGQFLPSSTASQIEWRAVKIIAWVIFAAYLAIFVHHNILVPRGLSEPIFAPQSSPRSQDVQPCTQSSQPSPYCNFSLVRTLTNHPAATAIALSEDGTTLVSGGSDKAIKVWDLPRGELEQTLQSDSGVITALAIAPDGHTVISGAGDRMVRIWDTATDQHPQMLRGHTTHNIDLVQVATDAQTIISGGYGEVKLWERITGDIKTTLPEADPTKVKVGPVVLESSSLSFRPFDISADGKKILAELGSRLIVWDLDTHQQIELPRQRFTRLTSAHFSLDGQTIVTTSYTQPNTRLKLWDLATSKLKADILLSNTGEHGGYGDRLALTRDRIIASTPTGLKVWHLQTGELEAVLDNQQVSQLVVSADGQQLIGLTGDASSENAQIQIWQRS